MQAIRAAEIESPSREELLASLKTSEEESKKLSRLLNNQYGKNSRQLKYHLQTVAGFQSELEQLKKSNDTLLTQKKSLEKLVASLRAEIASKNEAMQSAVKDCNFFEMLLCSRDKMLEKIEHEKRDALNELVALKSQLAALSYSR